MKKKVSPPQVGYSQVREMLAKGFSRANPFFFYIVCTLLGNPLGKWAKVLDRSHEGSSHRVPPTDSEGGHHLDTMEEVGDGGQGSPWLFLEFSFGEEAGIFQRCLPAGLCFPRFLDYRQQAFLGGGLLFFFWSAPVGISGVQMSTTQTVISRRQEKQFLELTARLFLENLGLSRPFSFLTHLQSLLVCLYVWLLVGEENGMH